MVLIVVLLAIGAYWLLKTGPKETIHPCAKGHKWVVREVNLPDGTYLICSKCHKAPGEG